MSRPGLPPRRNSLTHRKHPRSSPSIPSPALKPDEAAVYAAVGPDETPIDQIILKCGLPTSTVSSTLFALELKKRVKQLPGKHYVRVA